MAPELCVSLNNGRMAHGETVVFEHIGRPRLLCYEKNQRLEFQDVEVDEVAFTMGLAWYWAEKIDRLDYEKFKRLPEYRRAELAQLFEEVTIKQEQICRLRRFMGADCHNRGITSKGYNWGTSCENPRVVNCNNFHILLKEINIQLGSFCENPKDSIVFPYPCEFEMALTLSPMLLQLQVMTNCVTQCAVREGTFLKRVMGVDLYQSDYTHWEYNTSGQKVYYIDVGYKSATIFADGLSLLQMDLEHIDYIGRISRFLVCFDAENIYPKRTGAIYLVFEEECEPCDPCN